MLEQSPAQEPRLVVAIGASAGGLEPLQSLIEAAPPHTGIAFVILQHLSPDHPTLMQSLIARETSMPVKTVSDGDRLAPNTIYLLPAGAEMTTHNDVLKLVAQVRSSGEPVRPIDHFFISLAQDRGPRAAGVVLSGTGSDGAQGVSAIRAAGGLTLAQDASAAFGGMPDAAIRTGSVDVVIDPRHVIDEVIAYADNPEHRGPKNRPHDARFAATIGLLGSHFGIDFNDYKPGTVQRRITRRVDLVTSGDHEAYVEVLRKSPDERRNMYGDLLIGVTDFFRDGHPWEALEQSVDDIVQKAIAEEREIRAWVAGCASGEEAYSLAIQLLEAAERRGVEPRIRVFASDADQESVDAASAGRFSGAVAESLSKERRERWFTPDGDSIQVRPELRRMITFTRHNLLAEAPFTRVDIVSCRNLLIYLRTESRSRALSLLHFALRVDGLLMLGASESIDPFANEFDEINARGRIFRKRRDIRLLGNQPLPHRTSAASVATTAMSTTNERLLRAYDQVLTNHGPAGFLIDDQRRLIHVFGNAGRLLQLPTGRVTGDLIDQLDESLRIPLWSAVQRMFNRLEPVEVRDVEVVVDDERVPAQIAIQPIPDRLGGPTFALVTIDRLIDADKSFAPSEMRRGVPSANQDSAHTDVLFLERELQLTRETLQSTVEELEASNEELVAANEELQSTNEELQSVNEELHTVNAEYEEKIDELTELTNDLDNLLASTRIGTLFLDSDLCLRRFTPDVEDIFRIRSVDLGRPIEDFADRLGVPDLHDRLRQVVATGESDADRVSVDGKHQFVRMNPYVTSGKTDGVVLTIVNVDTLVEVQLELAEELSRFNAFNENTPSMIWAVDASHRFTYANTLYGEFCGAQEESLVGQTLRNALGGTFTEAYIYDEIESFGRVRRDGKVAHEVAVEIGGDTRWLSVVRFPFTYRDEAMVGAAAIDVTDSKQAAHEAGRIAEELQLLLTSFPQPVWMLDDSGVTSRTNPAATLLGDLPAYIVDGLETGADQLYEAPFGADGPLHLRIIGSQTAEGGRLVIGLDETTLVATQLELSAQNDAISERNVELDQFAHMASHDLRAPLRAMHLMAQQALEGEYDLTLYAERAADATVRMREAIDSLLSFADVGRTEMSMHETKLSDVVASVELDLREDLDASGGTIVYDELPSWVMDPVLVRRAVMNLVSNGLTHSGVEQPVVRIDASIVSENGHDFLDIEVSDNGHGIAEFGNDIDIFDPFTRLSTSHPGSGMGLAVVRRVAQRHGGAASVLRAGEDGTAIQLRLGMEDTRG